jgi:type I restriction enzyme, R subunit
VTASETEADTRANRIDPRPRRAAGWGVVEGSKIRREMICPGRITGGGGRANPLSADYVLSYRDRKLAVIEAKRAGLGHTDGVGQAKDYARRLQARFAWSTNGLGWYGIDMASGAEGDHALPFPSPEELWQRCFPEGNDWRDRFGAVPFETGGGKWEPRYYQHNAITAVLEAIARGRERILLTLATGTGKTSIAFQIAWKLFHASWNLSREPTRRPRILFPRRPQHPRRPGLQRLQRLPARRPLPDQPRRDPQAGPHPQERQRLLHDLPDLHDRHGRVHLPGLPAGLLRPHRDRRMPPRRRKGREHLARHPRILRPAVQLGLTATPKRDANADTYAYFGDPVYTYALKEGIGDGFLTPFKVRQMASTLDTYTFSDGDEVVAGEIDPDREYTEADFNTRSSSTSAS